MQEVEVRMGYAGIVIRKPSPYASYLTQQAWQLLDTEGQTLGENTAVYEGQAQFKLNQDLWLSGWILQGFYGCGTEDGGEAIAVLIHTETGHVDTISAGRLRFVQSASAPTAYKSPYEGLR
jgi:hypothetical protein